MVNSRANTLVLFTENLSQWQNEGMSVQTKAKVWGKINLQLNFCIGIYNPVDETPRVVLKTTMANIPKKRHKYVQYEFLELFSYILKLEGTTKVISRRSNRI